MKDEYRDGPYRSEPLPPRGGPPSDRRYYDYPPPPPRDLPPRDYRYPPRAGSPPRDMRDYPGPPVRSSREYFDDRRDYRGPPSYVPATRYDGGRPYYSEYDPRGAYGGPPAPPSVPVPRDPYDRPYDRRGPVPLPGASPYVPGGRPRSPPLGIPPRGRDDYDRSRFESNKLDPSCRSTESNVLIDRRV